ncbi:hypothetical protein G647_10027 [Cladophialophora carrionii CBS 160.54]|uniref:Uncharacterized protein n=1 Tax=Cladophialophora carrionii CBS 160.54 TaxID=1279043 RepID=V9DKV1_9EURO|nr:uncharacterized protein G647_10027 [Cladophialophora carrionii CBS 160.54]ETI26928.1 hypothetical protein G647_10027 [Cladophialophora carrionii CBS 160.54]
MRTKTITAQTDDQNDQAGDNGARRASGRVRKLTAKAVALNGSKSYSPPLSDTIVIGDTPPRRRRSSHQEHSPTPGVPREAPKDAQIEPEIPETPAKTMANGAHTPPPAALVQDGAPESTVETSPSRRHSRREKKPTPKAVSESQTAQKRPATEDSEEAPLRKSARLSYSSARVPSKLRYSVSSETSETRDTAEAERGEIVEAPVAKKSKVIVLKMKPQLRRSDSPTHAKNKASSAAVQETPRRTSERQKSAAKQVSTMSESRPRPHPTETPGSCDLSCLSPSFRLLAFAQIALQMPDEEDENAETVPGSVYDWRVYTQAWCQCDHGQPFKTARTNSAELARALMPNTVAQGQKHDYVDLSKSQTPENDLLLTPVNTILRVSDAERLSQLYTDPGAPTTSQSPLSRPAANGKSPADDLATFSVGQPLQMQASMSDGPHRASPLQSLPPAPPPQPSRSHFTRRTYEDRLRDDYHALGDIRKRATARGIPWTYNQTLEDIHALIVEAEEREQQTQYRQQVINPPTVLARMQDSATEARPSPTGFGVLLPPKGSTFAPRGRNSPLQANGVAGSSNQGGRPRKITFVEGTNPANPSKARQASSPKRPKSSRFRVDPRGLRGEAPGPGTIINMEDLKRQAEELKRLGQAMREFEAYQKMADAENEERALQLIKAEKKAREAAESAMGRRQI